MFIIAAILNRGRQTTPNHAARFYARKFCVKVLLVFLGVLSTGLPCSASAVHPEGKNVLVLFGSDRHDNRQLLDLIEAELRPLVRDPITFYEAYLTNSLDEAKDALYKDSQAETFRRLYAGLNLNLVIGVYPQAINFTTQYRNKMFPGVPIMFAGIGIWRDWSWRPPPGVPGATFAIGVRETIDLALRLHPDTKRVAIVAGPDWHWIQGIHSELSRRNVEAVDIVFQEASREVVEKVAALPPHTVALLHTSIVPTRSEFGSRELIRGVSQIVPTYSVWEYLCLDVGCIGGAYADEHKTAAATADIAARILSGERPDNIPVVHNTDLTATVDWRALQRWHVPDSALPPGTLVLNREPTLWQRGRNYFLAGIVVIVVQAFLIFGLFWQRARKRKAEAILGESETRFRVMADTTPSLIWMCDDQGKVIYLNEQRVSFTGSDPHAGYGDTWRAYVHPDDLKSIFGTFSNALKSRQPFSNQYRLRRRDGVYRWIFDVASPRVNGDGSFAGFIGSAVDVTDQKKAQEALEKVSGQLIEAQEQERTRLARELHDDICQRLAMLAHKIEKVNEFAGRGQTSVADELNKLWLECSNLAGDVQALSHELHPSILDHLGLATAVKSFCREVSEQNGIEVEFEGRDIPNSLPREVSLSLFRVIQEAIHNAIKHSGQKHFEVRLEEKDAQIELEVRDRGVGFDPASMQDGRGLGLVSMSERVHQVNGTLTIDSQPNIGTRIRARVPLAPKS